MSVIKISDTQYFSTEDGIVITAYQAARLIKNSIAADSNVTVNPVIQRVIGVDSKLINLRLVTQHSEVPSQAGFFVEVFLSGTDGSLIRLYQDDFVDPASLTPTRTGFGQYITLEVDV